MKAQPRAMASIDGSSAPDVASRVITNFRSVACWILCTDDHARDADISGGRRSIVLSGLFAVLLVLSLAPSGLSRGVIALLRPASRHILATTMAGAGGAMAMAPS
jgi:hypothetical protein